MGVLSWKETIGLQCFTKEEMALLETFWGHRRSPGPTWKALTTSGHEFVTTCTADFVIFSRKVVGLLNATGPMYSII